ncbi:cell wall hydrolase [Clostridium drakei]|uniref:Cell wall hydrolase n=1 Tax=Clostridium drakei TaxID=332101 RepID=A0A2U8DXR7_9CLOT|nr:cell wall hydrolase [Clostridium drakei]AWI07281.1 cell wall hydrolase [Clostridium drakei]
MRKFIFCIIFLLVPSVSPLFNVKAAGSDNIDSTLFKEQDQIVEVFNYSGRKLYVTQKDIHLMAQVVYAESNCEPFEGKVAVASVILNRLRYPEFPKTVEEVITQKSAFSCVKNGSIDVVPDESSYKAVLQALKGNDPTGQAVFFYNPKIATCKWMKGINKKNVKTIGNHVFFVVN